MSEAAAAPPGCADLLEALVGGAQISAPVAVVCAHPDDETLSAGGGLAALRDLRLVHLTDGAPRDPVHARRAGCADRAGYAARRRRELEGALAALEVRPTSRVSYGLVDQEAVFELVTISRRLAVDLAGTAAVITHAYEGGHPDHDTAAFAVAAACRLIAKQGAAPPMRLEFAGYHLTEGDRRVGRFWPDAGALERAAVLDGPGLDRKRRAAAAHASQAEVIAWFDLTSERYRQAPTYDFTRPPPPGAALYDQWGWRMTSEMWRAEAARALVELERA